MSNIDYEEENKIIRARIYALEKSFAALLALAFSGKTKITMNEVDVIIEKVAESIDDKEFSDDDMIIKKLIENLFDQGANLSRFSEFESDFK